MSKPFEFKDYNKRYKNLSTHNFPTLKNEKLQDSLKFKFTSSAQKGVKLESSVTNVDLNKTNSEFGVKLNFDDVKGVEVGFNAKSDPSLELSFKLDDSLVPLEGSSFTLKGHAKYPSEQTVSGAFAFANKLVNLNLGVTLPITKAGCSILKDDQEALNKQRYKVDFDFVARPVEDRDYYLGGSVKTQLPHKDEELFYTSMLSLDLTTKLPMEEYLLTAKKLKKKLMMSFKLFKKQLLVHGYTLKLKILVEVLNFHTPQKKKETTLKDSNLNLQQDYKEILIQNYLLNW